MTYPELSYVAWRRSSHSGNGGQCVELAVTWRTSSRSGNGGECVEVSMTQVVEQP